MTLSTKPIPILLLCFGLLVPSGPLPAQAASSTLARLAEQADIVARLRVLHATDDGHTKRVVFKVQGAWKGRLSGTFTLHEPSGRACGRALHGVLVGSSYVAFLDHAAQGTVLASGSSRALVIVDPKIVTHVRGLLSAANPGAQLSELTSALSSTHDRIRADAAMTLPRLVGLGLASAVDRRRIVKALTAGLDHGDATALSLIHAAARLRLREAAPPLLAHYLRTPTGALSKTLARVIPVMDNAFVVERTSRLMESDSSAQLQAVRILEHCSGRSASAILRRFAKSRIGLVAQGAESVLARRRPDAGLPKFRSIQPQRRR